MTTELSATQLRNPNGRMFTDIPLTTVTCKLDDHYASSSRYSKWSMCTFPPPTYKTSNFGTKITRYYRYFKGDTWDVIFLKKV